MTSRQDNGMTGENPGVGTRILISSVVAVLVLPFLLLITCSVGGHGEGQLVRILGGGLICGWVSGGLAVLLARLLTKGAQRVSVGAVSSGVVVATVVYLFLLDLLYKTLYATLHQATDLLGAALLPMCVWLAAFLTSGVAARKGSMRPGGGE